MTVTAKPGETLVFPPHYRHDPADSVKRHKNSDAFVVTASEIQSFRRCPRDWNYGSANRMALTRTGMPVPALNIGTGAHYVLARQTAGYNWLEAVNEHYIASKARVEADYLKTVGTGLSQEEQVMLSDQRWEVQRLMEAYFTRYGTEWPTKPYRIVAAEITFAVPLVPEQNIWFMGTLDRVYSDSEGSPVPGEIKTYKQTPKRENWRFNFQLYAYSCALAELLGEVPRVALYDGLRKKGPLEPRILKKTGRVSKAWIDTTYDEYIRVVRRAHHGRVPGEYRDILTRLMTRDKSPMNAFLTRFRIPLVQSAMEQTWDGMQITARQMRHTLPGRDDVVANKDWQGCIMCRRKDLCDAEFAGEDIQSIIDRDYTRDVSPTRKAQRFVTTGKLNKIARDKGISKLESLAEWSRDLPIDPLRTHAVVSDE
jgi:plasmid stability protein